MLPLDNLQKRKRTVAGPFPSGQYAQAVRTSCLYIFIILPKADTFCQLFILSFQIYIEAI